MNYFKLALAFLLLLFLSGCWQSNYTKNAAKIADHITLVKSETRTVTYEDSEYSCEDCILSLEQILELFDALEWKGDAFLYFPITPENLLQIMYAKENLVIVEITNDSETYIYHQKYATHEACKEIIEAMFTRDELDAEFMSNFYKVPIRSKTLDNMMRLEKKAKLSK